MPCLQRQAGISLPTALFVITVMAFLAIVVNNLVADNARGFDEELSLVRAFYAAESGAQFGMTVLFPPDGAIGSCPATPLSYAFSADGIKACAAEVSCSSVEVDSLSYFTVTSEGTCGQVSRTIQVRAQ